MRMRVQPSQSEITLYKEYLANRDYKSAALVLLPYKDHPRIMAQINKLRRAYNDAQHIDEVPDDDAVFKVSATSLFSIVMVVLSSIVLSGYLIWHYLTGQDDKSFDWL